jgi:hypothetical protein
VNAAPQKGRFVVRKERIMVRRLAAIASIAFGIFGCSQTTLSTVPPAGKSTVLSGIVKSGSTPVSGAAVTVYLAGNGVGSGATALARATTNTSGSFATRYSPVRAGSTVYAVSVGGSVGGKASNGSIGLVALAGGSPTVTLNEFSSVATEFALAQFTDAGGQIIGAPPSNGVGIAKCRCACADEPGVVSDRKARAVLAGGIELRGGIVAAHEL